MKRKTRRSPVKRVTAREYAAIKTLSGFRPRKSERRSFVFIDGGGRGKRVSPKSGRKGVYVYVYADRKGKTKFRPVRQYRKPLSLRRSTSYDLESTRLKTALAKHAKVWHVKFKSAEHRMRQSNCGYEKRHGINFRRASVSIARDLGNITGQFPSGGHFQVVVAMSIRDKSGKVRTYIETVSLSLARGQKLTKADMQAYVKGKVWRQVSINLDSHGFVSSDSAAHIGYLARNKGEKREDWVTRKGRQWGKADCDVVRITNLSYRIQKIEL